MWAVGWQSAPPAGVQMTLQAIITLSGSDSAANCLLKEGGKNFCGMKAAGSGFF